VNADYVRVIILCMHTRERLLGRVNHRDVQHIVALSPLKNEINVSDLIN
jgi:Zn-finger domain-containing protein